MMCPYIWIFRAFQKNPSTPSFVLRTSLIKANQNLKRDEIGQNSHHESNNTIILGLIIFLCNRSHNGATTSKGLERNIVKRI
jgi:hypothetical protein